MKRRVEAISDHVYEIKQGKPVFVKKNQERICKIVVEVEESKLQEAMTRLAVSLEWP